MSEQNGTPPILEVRALHKTFRQRGMLGMEGAREIVAVRDVSFAINNAGSMAIVGESGSGKTTVARILAGLERATSGSVLVGGVDRTEIAHRSSERRHRARQLQIVFQDPYRSLDPRQSARNCIHEVLRLHIGGSHEQRAQRVSELANLVGLDERQMDALPRALSGGQRQRIAIARALAAEPSVLVLDEAVAALDVSIQAQVLNLLADIREQTGIAYVFISHDLAVVRQITEEMIVMQKGEVVERGPTAKLLDSPKHPYTQLLRSCVPRPGWKPTRHAVTQPETWLRSESGLHSGEHRDGEALDVVAARQDHRGQAEPLRALLQQVDHPFGRPDKCEGALAEGHRLQSVLFAQAPLVVLDLPSRAADHVGQHHAAGWGRPPSLHGCCCHRAYAVLQAGHRGSETLSIVLNDGHCPADGGTHLPGTSRRVKVDVVGVTAGHLQRPGAPTTEQQPGRHPGIW